MKVNKKTGDKIYLEWTDAYEKTGWKSIDDVTKLEDERFCFTNGFYLGTKDGYVIVCHTRGKSIDNDVTGIINIPKAWIIKVK